jgi:TPR repeat protein
VFAFAPRIEPSAANVKAEVEQPVFVARRPAAPAPKSPAITAQPLAKDAIDKLATALHEPPSSAGAAAIPAIAIPVDDARRLCAEGLIAFAKGDIATARAFLARAADAGDARALAALGDTFDPMTLTRLGVVGIKGDEVKARDYYARALAAGAPGARERIAALAQK